MTAYEKIFDTLNRHGVRYLVVGGIAVVLYGAQRITFDLDIVVKLDAENTARLAKAADEAGLIPRVPVKIEQLGDENIRKRWIEEKGVVVFSLVTRAIPTRVVDIFVYEPFDFEKAYKERTDVKVGDALVPLVPIETLVRLKKEVARFKDLADVEAIEKLMKNGLI